MTDETGVEFFFFAVPEGLHPNTVNLVARFASALAEKLAAAERKYGYSDGWADAGWMDECRQKLVEHIAKGDPRDVAAYAAFLWHHGESTAGATPPTPKPDAVAGLVDELQVVAEHIHAAYPAQKVKRLRRLVATLAAALTTQHQEPTT